MVDEYIHEYIFSGSLPENASTYVTRSGDDELYEALQQGKFCYVLNSRQTGKSSLRVRTMSRLSQAGVECASIDLSSVSIQSATQENWYADLIVKLIDSFVLEVDFQDWWEKNQLNSPLMRFSNFLEKHLLVEIPENIVIFIDEIDSVLSLNFPTDDFFAFIRSCYNQRVDNPAYKRLTFCLLGVASPGNLIQDKNRTPFNIGKAISLEGFKLDEVEPLIKGLSDKFSDSQGVMAEILTWTGGQPFLTQKLCQFMMEESEQENPRTVAEVVKSRIIENWESQDEPEHLRTIRSRILRNEEHAAYLLELYQQIWRTEVEPNITEEQTKITADNTIEQSELLLSGLVARREGKLRIYNAIYKEVFNPGWVETELNNLRPYSQSFRFWLASGAKDESLLLRGKTLTDAEKWAKDKNLSYQDKQFLAASRERVIQEKIAAEEQAAQLERGRKDREALEQRNQLLNEANVKAKRRIRNGTVVLVVALLGAVSLGVLAAIEGNKAFEAQKMFKQANTKVKEANERLKEANQKFENANTKAEQERKKVLALQQQAQKATEQAKEEQEKAEQAEKFANDANQKAIEANQKFENANTKAKQERKKIIVLQQQAQQAQQTAKLASQQAQAVKQEAQRLQNQIASVKNDIKTVKQLSQLAGKLHITNNTHESNEALRRAGLSFRVNDRNLKQALLFASMAQANFHLKKLNESDKNFRKSLLFLQNSGSNVNSEKGVQIKFLLKNTEVSLLEVKRMSSHNAFLTFVDKKAIPKAIKLYTEAFNIIKKNPYKTNPFNKDAIITIRNIESVHRELIDLLDLLENRNQANFKQQVKKSLKQYFLAELEYLLKTKKWIEADTRTTGILFFITNSENKKIHERLTAQQIKNLSCLDLKQIDNLWIRHSKGHFGFSVQHKIWLDTANRLEGIQPRREDYLRFASAVGWYQEDLDQWMSYGEYIDRIRKQYQDVNTPIRGGIPMEPASHIARWTMRRKALGRSHWRHTRTYNTTDTRQVTRARAFFSRIATCKL